MKVPSASIKVSGQHRLANGIHRRTIATADDRSVPSAARPIPQEHQCDNRMPRPAPREGQGRDRDLLGDRAINSSRAFPEVAGQPVVCVKAAIGFALSAQSCLRINACYRRSSDVCVAIGAFCPLHCLQVPKITPQL